MTENTAKENEKTKSGFGCKMLKGFSVFIRWVFIIFFALLLLAGLYFKAPWKILVLIGLLLALQTVVPKPKRKYGWLTLTGLALCVTIWIFLPESDSGNWRPYTFNEEVAALNAKYSVPDEENAAAYYKQIEVTDFYEGWTLEDHFADNAEKRGPVLWDPDDETLRRPWKSEEFPEMAAWLETEKEKIAPFFEAVKFEKCWFEINLDNSDNAIINVASNSEKIRKSKDILYRMVNLNLGENNIQKAIEKLSALQTSALHLQQQGSLIDNLIGWAIYSGSARKIRNIVINYDLKENQLLSLQNTMERFEADWNRYLLRNLEYEKYIFKTNMGLLFEMNDRGKIRLSRQPEMDNLFDHQTVFSTESKKEPFAFSQKIKNKIQRLVYWVAYNHSPEEISEFCDTIFSELIKSLAKDSLSLSNQNAQKKALNFDFNLESYMKRNAEKELAAFGKIQWLYYWCQSHQKATLIVIALRRYYNQHGHWPYSLEAIKDQLSKETFVDSATGQKFIYERPAKFDSFILYGFGEDGIDDKGIHHRSWSDFHKGKRGDDDLFWPAKMETLFKIRGIEEDDML